MHKALRAGLAGLVVVLSGCWLAPNQGPDRSGYNAVERALTPATAPTLTEQWHAEDVRSTGLVAYGARVYAYGRGVEVFAVSTGQPLWSHFPDWRFQVRDGFVDGDEIRLHVWLINSFTWDYDAATGADGGRSDDGPVSIRGATRSCVRPASKTRSRTR